MSRSATEWAWTQKGLSVSEKFLLVALADRASVDENLCWPSKKKMMDDTGISKNTLTKILKSLQDKSLIIQTGKFVGKSNQVPIYKILCPTSDRQNDHDDQMCPIIKKSVDKSKVIHRTHPKIGSSTHPKIGSSTHPKIGLRNLKEETKEETEAPPALSSAAPTSFLQTPEELADNHKNLKLEHINRLLDYHKIKRTVHDMAEMLLFTMEKKKNEKEQHKALHASLIFIKKSQQSGGKPWKIPQGYPVPNYYEEHTRSKNEEINASKSSAKQILNAFTER